MTKIEAEKIVFDQEHQFNHNQRFNTQTVAQEYAYVHAKGFLEGCEWGVRKAANIADRFTKDPYTSDTRTECENVRNLILALLQPKEEE